ncbi:MAG: amino acid adenylation enzyme/thioester reductase family protein [Deltaproteobacteria bacterium]|nr:amino acid adenylation enzyme/thioester reductase family protein [Deltaproteobacteria bacterium]
MQTGGEVTLVEIVRRRAASEGERVAYVFLVDGERDEQTLTYAELEARARRVAVALAARGAEGSAALLLFDPGLDFIVALFGCFFAGVMAVPLYPPDPRDMTSGIARLRRIATDARASIVLTTEVMRSWVERGTRLAPDPIRMNWCAIDGLPIGSEAAWNDPLLDRNRVAFLQYTSGSTGTPRGVMVTHGNLLAHGEAAQMALSLTPEAVAVSWLPLYHDMGLVGTVLIPMQLGFVSVQIPPAAFLERPLRWLQALSRYRGTLSPAPNFAYDLVLRRTTPEERRGVDLSAWAAAMNGAEPVRADSCEQFVAALAACGFRREALVPCYGLAEATLMVAGGPAGSVPATLAVDGAALEWNRVVETTAGSAGARVLVGCGRVAAGLEVAIVDPEACTGCSGDEVGEIWVAGPQVASGYWGRADDSAATFGARLVDDDRGPFLRTGDLGFVRDGVLFVTGRRKDLIVIRGRNYYPQDLEHTSAQAHVALRPGGSAAFSIDGGGAERLVIVQEIDADAGAMVEEARAAIRRAIAREHALHAHAVVLIAPRALPRTSSGKVRRRACRAAFQSGRLPVVAARRAEAPRGNAEALPATSRGDGARPNAAEIEAWLVRTVTALRGASHGRVRPGDAWVALGVDSAEAAEVAAGLAAWLGRPVPLRLLMEHPTIAELAWALHEVAA